MCAQPGPRSVPIEGSALSRGALFASSNAGFISRYKARAIVSLKLIASLRCLDFGLDRVDVGAQLVAADPGDAFDIKNASGGHATPLRNRLL